MTTTTTYNQIGVREDLADQIYNIAPTETPFTTMIQKGKRAQNRIVEWQTDTLAAANADNSVLEGADASYLTATPTSRLRNHTQIFEKSVIVSTSANAVNTAGREEELAYQLMKRTKEIKRDLEARATGNFPSRAGSSNTARRFAGFESWITTNDSRGTGGTQGGFNSGTGLVAAPTDASSTNRRTFTEVRLRQPIRDAWSAGGEPDIIMVGPWNKQQASQFAGIATKYNVVGRNTDSNMIVGAADMYVSDFGVFKVVPNRFSRDRSALIIDPKLWSLHYLQPPTTKPLAQTGHAERRMITFEVTLACRQEAGNAILADLRTS